MIMKCKRITKKRSHRNIDQVKNNDAQAIFEKNNGAGVCCKDYNGVATEENICKRAICCKKYNVFRAIKLLTFE